MLSELHIDSRSIILSYPLATFKVVTENIVQTAWIASLVEVAVPSCLLSLPVFLSAVLFQEQRKMGLRNLELVILYSMLVEEQDGARNGPERTPINRITKCQSY